MMFSRMSSNPEARTLTVDLTRRLPDVDRAGAIPSDIEDYGRFGILRSVSLWFGSVRSSHPATTLVGFYWAISNKRMYISPRGSNVEWQSHISADVIRDLVTRIGLKPRFKYFRVVDQTETRDE